MLLLTAKTSWEESEGVVLAGPLRLVCREMGRKLRPACGRRKEGWSGWGLRLGEGSLWLGGAAASEGWGGRRSVSGSVRVAGRCWEGRTDLGREGNAGRSFGEGEKVKRLQEMGEGEETNGVRARGRRRPAFCLEWEKKGLGCLGIFVLPKKSLFQNPPHRFILLYL